MMTTALFMVFAYLMGSLSSAIIVCKLLHLPDPRSHGSLNPGTTNVLRLGGKKAAIITLLGDSLKGFIPVFLAHLLKFPSLQLALILIAAFIGHLYPVFFRFEGGKGVATAFGGLLGMSWGIGALVLFTWLGVAALFRYSSLAALIAAVAAPAYSYFFTNGATALVISVMSLLLIWRHKTNIQRLLAGEESKLGKKAKTS